MICAECAEEVDESLSRCPLCEGEPLLAGRLRLDAIDSIDALGTTYRATRIADGCPLWLRELPFRRGPGDPSAALEREAERLATLRHPCLPGWSEAFVRREGRMGALWIAQIYDEGLSLARRAQRGGIEESELYQRLEALAGLLAHLHAQKPPIVHGGISPSSVIESSAGGWLLVGFNAIGTEREISPVSGSGVQSIARAMANMAPEQFYGRAEPASDVWGLGLIAVVLLTGAQAIDLRDAEHRLAWHDQVAIDPSFARLLDELLEREPSKRPSAAELSDRVAALRRSKMSTVRLPLEVLREGDDRPAPVVGSIGRRRAPEADSPTDSPTRTQVLHEPRRPARRATRRSESSDDVPVARPADLSRDLSMAHRATEQLLGRARRRGIAGRMLLVLFVALVSALIVWMTT